MILNQKLIKKSQIILNKKSKHILLKFNRIKKKRKPKLIYNKIMIKFISIIVMLTLLYFKKLVLIINPDNYNTSKNNKGFLKINTIHKSKITNYDYKNNIIVHKDLYNNIPYVPITSSNSILKSDQIANESYFELCQNRKLLDNTNYKRSINPKISVIIPFYNKDLFSIYIPLRSIQNQSLKDIEIIFVDDGSSENKINEIFEEMKNDNRIIFLKHKENKGTLLSRVDGVRYASGDYILHLDQDDLFIDNLFFENIYRKAKELNVDILQFATMSYKINLILIN